MSNPCSYLFQSYLVVYCGAGFESRILQKIGECPTTKLDTPPTICRNHYFSNTVEGKKRTFKKTSHCIRVFQGQNEHLKNMLTVS